MQPTAAKRISDPALLRAEAIRTRQGAAIGEATGLFSVPDVISAEGRRLVTTLVPGIVPLRQALHEATRQEAIRIACWAGRVLAAIHTRKEPEFGGSSVGWRGSFTRPDPVWVHGDFGMTNVQIRVKDGTIVVLDWAPPAWARELSYRASSHWDVALFLVDMAYQRPRDPLFIRKTRTLSSAFLTAYMESRPTFVPNGLRTSLAQMTANYYRHAGTGPQRVARMPSSAALLLNPPSTGKSRPRTNPRRHKK